MKNVYYQGKLIPVKDWNFETKKPKTKAPKKEENPQMAESEDLSIISTEATE